MTRKQEILVRYRQIVIEIKALELQSEFLKEYIGGPKPLRGVHLTGMPRGTNDPEAAILQRADYDDAIYIVEEKEKELRNLAAAFEGIMDSIQDDWDRIIIRHYYALGWTDKQIAKDIGFDKSTVWKRRKSVMDKLDD
jgi:hypothetical protein